MHRQTPIRILLIEDHTVAAISLECLLEDLGHSVVDVAATPLQARRAVEQFRGDVDLVIYNAFLVGHLNLDIADQVDGFGLPALVTSSMAEADLRALYFDAPYLPQPFTKAGVEQALNAFQNEDKLTAA